MVDVCMFVYCVLEKYMFIFLLYVSGVAFVYQNDTLGVLSVNSIHVWITSLAGINNSL